MTSSTKESSSSLAKHFTDLPSASVTSPILEYYRWAAPLYDVTRWAVLPGRRLAVDALELKPGETVLEIGTGTGSNLPSLCRTVGPSGWVIGIDLSPDMLAQARRRIRRNRLGNAILIRANAEAFALTRHVDAVLMSDSLSMMPNRDQVAALAAAALRPGGRLVAVDFGPFSGWGPLRALVRWWLRLNHVTLWTDAARTGESALWSRFRQTVTRPLLRSYATLLVARDLKQPAPP